MRKIAVVILLGILAVSAFAADQIEGGVVTFNNANSTAKLDTALNNDTLVCVVSQMAKGVLADKMVLYLPKVLAASDSFNVLIQALPTTAGLGPASENRNYKNQSYKADNVAASNSTGDTYVFNTADRGDYSFTNQPQAVYWTPKTDSLATPRVRICLIATAGNPILTGADSLATSTVVIQKVFSSKQ